MNRGKHSVKVVILAAGDGTRLRNGRQDLIKPMVTLYGLTLIERVILAAKEAGFQHFVVVVGFKKEVLLSHLSQLAMKHDVTIETVENPDWEKGNGTSVFACRHHVDGGFYLLMCDHLFDPAILRDLADECQDGHDPVLAVDHRIDQIFDLEDATKVRHVRGRLVAIGKTLTSFNAIDTGIFYCTPVIFEALERSFRDGEYALSDGIRRLAEAGRMRIHEIGDRFWMDIDTPESLEHAKRRILDELPKTGEDGMISRFLNRSLSTRLTAVLASTPLTPNMITLVSLSLGLLAATLFARGTTGWTVLAGLLVQFSSLIDGCDGELARLKFQATPFGGWLDTILDRYVDAALVAGITYGYWLNHPSAFCWLGGIVGALGFLITSYARKEYLLRYGAKLPRTLLQMLTRRDVRLLAIFAGALAGVPYWTMVALGLFGHLWVIGSFLSIYWHEQKHHITLAPPTSEEALLPGPILHHGLNQIPSMRENSVSQTPAS